MKTANLTIDLGQLGEHNAVVEYNYSPKDNGGREYPSSPEDWEIMSVKIAGKDMGKKVWINIGPAISDKHAEQIIEQIKEL